MSSNKARIRAVPTNKAWIRAVPSHKAMILYKYDIYCVVGPFVLFYIYYFTGLLLATQFSSVIFVLPRCIVDVM